MPILGHCAMSLGSLDLSFLILESVLNGCNTCFTISRKCLIHSTTSSSLTDRAKQSRLVAFKSLHFLLLSALDHTSPAQFLCKSKPVEWIKNFRLIVKHVLVSVFYRVFNFKWHKKNLCHGQTKYLNDLKLIFFGRQRLDVFCIKISLVYVKEFVFYLNLKWEPVFT